MHLWLPLILPVKPEREKQNHEYVQSGGEANRRELLGEVGSPLYI